METLLSSSDRGSEKGSNECPSQKRKQAQRSLSLSSLVRGSWWAVGVDLMVAVQQEPLAPPWGGHSTCSTRRFHILWVKPLSFPQPREGNRGGVIMPILQARKLSPGSGRDWPRSPQTEWVVE